MISVSAFAKASHRLRSMCLVSGYLLQMNGSLSVKIASSKEDGQVEYEWVNLYEGQSELVVCFHPR